jgi:hypothetical protein
MRRSANECSPRLDLGMSFNVTGEGRIFFGLSLTDIAEFIYPHICCAFRFRIFIVLILLHLISLLTLNNSVIIFLPLRALSKEVRSDTGSNYKLDEPVSYGNWLGMLHNLEALRLKAQARCNLMQCWYRSRSLGTTFSSTDS